MLAPLLIFVYNRPDHTKETTEALANNFLAKETEVFIFSDAAKNDKSTGNVKLVREYIEKIEKMELFKSVKIIKAESNKGLGNSIISGVSEIIEQYGRVIVLEDDLKTSKDFLQYMNDALNYYEKDNEIWSISGYTFNIDIPKGYKSQVYLSYRGCSWGWATWKDRWGKVDWDISDYISFKNNKALRNKFNRGGRDMADMLDLQMEGKIDSWAIRWCYAQFKLDMLTVYPLLSRITNLGLDGTGTHKSLTTKFDNILNSDYKQLVFDKPTLNKRINKSFTDRYGTGVEYFILTIKTFIKKILGM